MELISFHRGPPLEIPDHLHLTVNPTAVRLPDGLVVWVRAVPLHAADEPQAALERLTRLATVRGGNLLRPLAALLDGRRLVVAEEASHGVSLRTLQRVVPFTWEQASVVGEGLFAAVAGLEAGQASHGDITSDTVHLSGDDGRVRLAAPDPRPVRPDGPSDLAAAAALVRSLLEGASPPSRRAVAAPVRDRLLDLAGAADLGQLSAAQIVTRWRRALAGPLGASGKVRVRRQLQALAGRLGQQQTRAGHPVPGLAAAPALAASGTAAGRSEPGADFSQSGGRRATVSTAASGSAGLDAGGSGRATETSSPEPNSARPGPAGPGVRSRLPAGPRRRGWLAAGTILLLVLVGAGTTLALAGRGGPEHPAAGGSRSSRPTPSSSASTPAAPSPSPTPTATPLPSPSPTASTLREMPVLGPASNPPINDVQLTAGCPSSGHGSCAFAIRAGLGAHPAEAVDWRLVLVNRCSGSVSQVASGQISAPASYTYIEAQAQVNVPSSTPVGLVALVGAPNSASSSPILITPPGAACSG